MLINHLAGIQPVRSETMNHITVREALDKLAREYSVIWVYTECESDKGVRGFYLTCFDIPPHWAFEVERKHDSPHESYDN
jgi:hypothetical protein